MVEWSLLWVRRARTKDSSCAEVNGCRAGWAMSAVKADMAERMRLSRIRRRIISERLLNFFSTAEGAALTAELVLLELCEVAVDVTLLFA